MLSWFSKSSLCTSSFVTFMIKCLADFHPLFISICYHRFLKFVFTFIEVLCFAKLKSKTGVISKCSLVSVHRDLLTRNSLSQGGAFTANGSLLLCVPVHSWHHRSCMLHGSDKLIHCIHYSTTEDSVTPL